jgi:redox-sensitive bicupin YhaK (pirin superfamily)
MILADIQLQANSRIAQQIPASFNTFLYVIEGDLFVGEENKILIENQVGWLDRFSEDTGSELSLRSGEKGSRVILYSAQPTNDQIVSYGPFIADTQEDIKRLYKDYREGKMKHISTVPESQQILL